MGRYNKYIVPEIIPSKTMRDYYIENNIDLTEVQLIRLTWEQIPIEKKIEIYEYILEEPENAELAQLLKGSLNCLKFEYTEAESHKEDAVYYLYEEVPEDDYKKEPVGIYKQYEAAKRIGLKTGHEFLIERYIARELSEEEIQALEKDAENEDLPDTKDLSINFNKNGQATLVWFHPLNPTEEIERLQEADSKFENYIEENIYRDFPCPFENGDFVRDCYRGEYGVIRVMPDHKEWAEGLISRGIIPSDEEYCEIPDEDGEFCHGHFMAAYLEKVSIEEVPEEMREVLQQASYLYKGEGSIDGLQYTVINMKYRRRNRLV